MKRDSAVGIEFRGEQVGQVATIFNACLPQFFQGLVWIADTMHHHAASGKGGSRLNQELLQLAAALIVTPIANPDHVNLAAAADRLKGLYIGSLMECPHPRHAEAISIDTPDGFSESEYAIHQMQMKLEYFPGAGIGAMVAIMKQSDEAIFLLQGQNAIDHKGIIPFVQKNDVGFSQLFAQEFLKIFGSLIEAYVQLRVAAAEMVNGLNGAFPFMSHEIGKRPGTKLFIAAHLVPLAHQFAHKAAQKVDIPVVPIRDQGMAEQSDIQFLFHAGSAFTGIRV